jgi:uncharacterized protein
VQIPLYVVLVILALMGNARIGLFSLNRLVFAQKHESDRLKWALRSIPVTLLLLAPLYGFLIRDFARGEFTPFGWAGSVWLLVTVSTGIYWTIDRAWHNLHPPEIGGVRSFPPEVVRLRKAHNPFRTLRRLGAHNDVYDLEITHHQIIIADLPEEFDGYRIAFMTDTHVAGFMRRPFYRECVEQIRSREVDLVLLGGDFVTWQKDIPLMARVLLDGLEARDGIYAVLGNHDYWADADSVVAAMTAKGVRFLINRSTRLRRGNAVIDLVGIDELYRGEPDIEAAFAAVPGNRPCIAVSHHPDIVEAVGDERVDLLVAGHTHGGQIRFPFFGAVVVPSKHEGLYASGFHRHRNTLLYVSRGIGAIPPIRILCRPELATFTLVTDRREPDRETTPGPERRSEQTSSW